MNEAYDKLHDRSHGDRLLSHARCDSCHAFQDIVVSETVSSMLFVSGMAAAIRRTRARTCQEGDVHGGWRPAEGAALRRACVRVSQHGRAEA
eukprot:6185867-Pleurochrysis_carterae.AAC.2